MIYTHITCVPCQAPSSSLSLKRRTYTPELNPLAQSPCKSPPLSSSNLASSASYPWCCEWLLVPRVSETEFRLGSRPECDVTRVRVAHASAA